jgi:uncharacterized protein YkwD
MSRRASALALAVLTACAGSHRQPTGTTIAPPPPPGTYGADGPVVLTSLERAAAEAARRAGSAATVSSALTDAARALARSAAAGEPDSLAASAVRAALTSAAAHDPAPRARLVAGTGSDLAEILAGQLPRDATHLGIGAHEHRGRAWLVALASRRTAELEPFPREVSVGARRELRASLVGLERAQVVVTRPSGGTQELAVAAGRSVRVALAFDEPGRHVVELVGTGPRGPEVAAILTVTAGGERSTLPARRVAAPDPHDRDAAERRVEEALNALRARQGLAPVASDPTLKAIARRHSEEMLARGVVAHVLPGSGDLAARLRGARVIYRRAVENVARGRTALEAHEVAEESPAHRRNMLDPEVHLAGVGIARAGGGPGDAVYLTQILVARGTAWTAESARAELRRILERARAAARAEPLAVDPLLDALAQRTATGMARGEAGAERRLAAAALALEGRRRSAADTLVAQGPEAAGSTANATEPRFRRYGTGIATDRERPGQLWIAVAFTD